jgi:hypothetical protein
MSSTKREFVGRRPRYSVAEGHPAESWLEQAHCRLAAELTNFSRHGVGLLTGLPMDQGDHIIVRIRHAPSSLDLSFACTVQWQHADDSGRWLVGCEFAQPMSFETLGELFLHGILEADSAPRAKTQ